VTQIKKILLAAGVIAAFVIYSFAMRHHDSSSVVATSSSDNASGSTTSNSTNAGGSGTSGDSSSSSSSTNVLYKDGTFTGSVADAFYGNVQVQATVKNGKITDVEFLQFPNDSDNSQSINSQATPQLKQEAVQAQSAHVDIVSGATQTSQAFTQSLSAALKQAQT
jgi:uncharacterized protein with FMN-binding domain